MPKAKAKKQPKQKQKQRQSQSVKVVVNLAKPKSKRRPRRKAIALETQATPVPLPPVFYQAPAPLTLYDRPEYERKPLLPLTDRREPQQRIPWVVENQPSQVLENPADNVNLIEPVARPTGLADQSISVNTMEQARQGQPNQRVNATPQRRSADREISSQSIDENISRHSGVSTRHSATIDPMFQRGRVRMPIRQRVESLTESVRSDNSSIPSVVEMMLNINQRERETIPLFNERGEFNL